MTEPRIHTCPECGATKVWRANRLPYGRCAKCRGKAKNSKAVDYKLAWDLKKYGLTVDDFDALMEFQEGRCWICQKRPQKGGRRLSVDHEHRTGLIRGLLCNPCNQMLGYMHENARVFARAANYLNHPPALDLFRPPRRHVNAPPVMEEQQ